MSSGRKVSSSEVGSSIVSEVGRAFWRGLSGGSGSGGESNGGVEGFCELLARSAL